MPCGIVPAKGPLVDSDSPSNGLSQTAAAPTLRESPVGADTKCLETTTAAVKALDSVDDPVTRDAQSEEHGPTPAVATGSSLDGDMALAMALQEEYNRQDLADLQKCVDPAFNGDR